MVAPDAPPRPSLLDRLRKFFGRFRLAGVVGRLRAHNDGLKELLTEDGKRELDRLVLLEAAVLARLRNATDMLSSEEKLDLLLRRSGSAGFYSAQTREEVRDAARDERFLSKVWGKCKAVANGKIKKWAGGLFGSGDDKSEADDD